LILSTAFPTNFLNFSAFSLDAFALASAFSLFSLTFPAALGNLVFE
jgi:hypothetical protein